MKKGIASSFGATAIRSVPGPKSSDEQTIVRPTPMLSLIRLAMSAAASVPMFPSARTTPMVAAERSRSRTA
jgi:hypothetical protein